MNLGVVLTATNTGELDVDLNRVFQGQAGVSTVVRSYEPAGGGQSNTGNKILSKALRNPVAVSASKALLKHEIDTSIWNTPALMQLCRQRNWDAVLLTHQDRLKQSPGRIRQILDLFAKGDVDVVYDGDCPFWSEVVSVETLERYGTYVPERFAKLLYPTRFFYFRQETNIRVANIGLAHRDYSFNGSFILPGGGMTIGDQGDVTWRLKHIPDVTGKTFLDIGCEEGYAVFTALQKGAVTATGLNIDETVKYDLFPEHRRSEFPTPTSRTVKLKENTIAWLRAVYGFGDDKARFRYQSIYEIGSETYDVVYCFGVMYHVKDPFLAIERLYAATRETLVVESQGIPDQHQGPTEAAMRWFQSGADVAETLGSKRLIAEFDPKGFNFWLFSPALLQTLLLQVGFKNVTVEKRPRLRKDSVVCRATK